MENNERLDLEVKYQNYWNILKQNHEMIRFSELKSGFIISIYGIIFSLMFNSIGNIKEILSGNSIILAVGILFIIVTIISFAYSFMCFIPRFENKNPTSVIYFGDIISDFEHYKAYFEYVEKTLQNEEEFSLQLAEQIHTNAAIATRKFSLVSKSIKLLLVAILILISSLILVLIL